jgi:hypothetical protein
MEGRAKDDLAVERKLAVEALSASEARYRRLAEVGRAAWILLQRSPSSTFFRDLL